MGNLKIFATFFNEKSAGLCSPALLIIIMVCVLFYHLVCPEILYYLVPVYQSVGIGSSNEALLLGSLAAVHYHYCKWYSGR